MGFLNPGLLGLLGLGAVPVIIHLLNRRRYQVVRWPAMAFLLQAQVKTRQRLRMENLLLLLARTLAVLLFAMAASRPFLPSSGALAAFEKDRRHLYILLDNSASMGYQEGISTLLSRAVRDAKAAVDGLPPDNPVTLVVACDEMRRKHGRPLAILRASRDHAKVKDTLEKIPLSHARMDPAASLAEVLAVAEPADIERVLRILSDFQRGDWSPHEGTPTAGEEEGAEEAGGGQAAAIRSQLRRLEEGRFAVDPRRLGSDDAEDVGVVSVGTVNGRVPAEGIPTAFEVVVANHGPGTVRPEVRFSVDGREQGSRRVEVPGRPLRSPTPETVRVSFPWTGARGEHYATAEVVAAGDRLPVNNRRGHAFRVRDRVRVLAVDGDPAPKDRFPETRLFEVTLSLSRGFLPAEVRVVPEADLPRESLEGLDLVVLANLASVADRDWDRLADFVRRGGGLWIFLGARTDPALWNAALRRPGVDRLLPARLGPRPRVDGESPVSVDLSPSAHPALRDLTDPRAGTSFEPPLVSGWWPVQLPLEEGTEVLLRLRDLPRTPLLLERRAGRGRVLLTATTADDEWMGLHLFYAAFVQEVTAYLASAGEPSRDLLVHQPLAAEVGETARGASVLATLPHDDGGGPDEQRFPDVEPVLREDPEGSGGRTRSVVFPDTARAGRYVLSWKVPAGRGIATETEEVSRTFAVNLDPREGDVARLKPEEIAARFGIGAAPGGGEDGAGPDGRQRRAPPGDLTGLLLALGVAMLVAEMFLASRFGRKRG